MQSFIKQRKVLVAAAAASLVLAGSAKAQEVTLQLNQNLVGLDSTTDIPTQTLPLGASWSSGYYGVYQFQVVGGPANGQTIWSTCLSPSGEVNYNPYTYTITPFSAAQPGAFPAAWTASADGTQLWGVQNAAYLWQQLGSAQTGLQSGAFHNVNNVLDTSTTDAGAALELAMFVALYDSTGYGQYNINSHFTPSGLSAGIQADLNGDLAVLANNLGPVAAGSILVPTPVDPSYQQDFILLDSDTYNLTTAPEPVATTMAGGLVAVLAFAGGAVRRKFSVNAK